MPSPALVAEGRTPLPREFFRIELSDQGPEALFEFGDAHPIRLKRQVEERALLPTPVFKQSVFGFQTIIEGSSRKRRLNRHLHVIQTAPAHELDHMLEAVFALSIEA